MMDDDNLLLLVFWTQLRYVITSLLFLFLITARYFNANSTMNFFSAAIKLEGRSFLLSADIVYKRVTMVTNHQYVTRPTSANDKVHNIV